MSFKGFVRSVERAAREQERARKRAEREQMRRAREQMRAYEAAQKEAEALHGAKLVAAHEAFVTRLMTVHARGSQAWNWQAIAQTPPPAAPHFTEHHERHAQAALEAYKPSVKARLLGSIEEDRQRLAAAVTHAKHQDQVAYQQAIIQHQADLRQWQWRVDLAHGILSGNVDAYRAAVEVLFPIATIPELSDFSLGEVETEFLEVTMVVQAEDDIVPHDYPSLTKTGKLSWKQYAKTKYRALVRSHVSSCVLRIAWEMLALLPVNTVYVHVSMGVFDPATGHVEDAVVMSVEVPRNRLLAMNPHRLEPVAAVDSLRHAVKFTARNGFHPVDSLSPYNLS